MDNIVITKNKDKQCLVIPTLVIPSVKRFRLENNFIVSKFPSIENLQRLELSNITLHNFDLVNHKDSLVELVITNCSLKDVNFVTKMEKLKILDLSHNYLTTVAGLKKFMNLKILILTDNQITSAEISYMKNLNVIRIDSNALTKFTVSIIELKELYLVDNKLKELNLCTESCALQVLNASRNSLKIVKKNMFEKTLKIRIIDLSSNTINSIKASFSNLEYLVELHLQDNKIKFTNFKFHKLFILRVLNLRKNEINDLNNNLNYFLELAQFDFSNNNINSYSLGDISKLKVLNASQNKLPSLQAFHLGSCKIVHIAIFSRNLISSLANGTFAKCTMLRILELNSNLLTNFPRSAFSDRISITFMQVRIH